MLIVYIKTLAILKCQRFDDSDSKERASRVYKCQRIDESDNEKQGLDEYESEINGYIFLPPACPLSLPQKKSNRLSDLDKRTRSLIHLICISKTANQRIANFASKFPGRKGLKSKKNFI